MYKRAFICYFIAVFLAVILAQPAFALRASVQRLVFENKSRSQVINIINESNEDQTYRIGWKDFRMSEDRMLTEVKTEEGRVGLKLAAPYLRYAPRRITIPANSAQQVRVIARMTSDMADGEYRSHLYIAPEAKQPEFSAEQQARAKTKTVVKINTLTGLAFPVFIRKGNLTATGRIEDATLLRQDNNLEVYFNLVREGNRSLFGDIDLICAGDYIAKQSIGVAVYTEVSKRRLSFKLTPEETDLERCHSMEIVYRAEQEDPQYQGGEIARAAVSLQ